MDDLPEVLRSRYERLNLLWERGQAELRKLLVPVEVVIQVWESPNKGYLGWGKFPDGWLIYVTETAHTSPHELSVQRPILNCSAEIRVAMVEHYPKLRAKIMEEGQKTVDQLDRAIEELENVVNGTQEDAEIRQRRN